MSALEWKNFDLFKIVPLVEFPKLNEVKGKLTSCCYNKDYKIFCDDEGWAHVYKRSWESISFQADTYPIKLCSLSGNSSNILVTVRQEYSSNDIYLQVFNLQKMSKKDGAACLGVAHLKCILSSVNILATFNFDTQICIVMGFEKGDIYFYKGPMNRDLSLSFKSYSIGTDAITGIGFMQKDPSSCIMFVSSNGGVFSLNIDDTNSFGENKLVLDSKKEISRASTMGYNILGDSYYTVGRDDAVYCFTTDGRGPCYVVKGKKQFLGWFGNYLLIASKQSRNFYDYQETTCLIIVDVLNKMIVLNKEFDQLWDIIIQNNNCFLITATKEILILREKNTRSKINLLVKKNMYEIALSQLGDVKADLFLQAEINLLFGDYLFQKGEMEMAVKKYSKTIGFKEPYCIIKKLLDSRYTKYLILYLEAVLRTEYGTKEHYDLLLNCCERIEMPIKVENQFYNGFSNMDILPPSPTKLFEKDLKINKIGLINNLPGFIEIIHDLNRIWRFFEYKEENEILTFLLNHQQYLDSKFPKKILKILILLKKKGKIINYEKFLPVLMPDKENILEYLTNILDSDSNCNYKIYNNIFKLRLESWRDGFLSEKILLEFLKKYGDFYNKEHIMILCRMFNFWNGIIFLLNKSHYDVSPYFLMKQKNFDMKQLDRHCSIYNAAFIIQYLQNSTVNSEDLKSFLNKFLNTVFEENPNSILQVMGHVNNKKNVTVGHIKDFFNKDFLKKSMSLDNAELVKKLEEKFLANENLCKSFWKHPIEFRNSICEKCRQELTFPAVYFLCQHGFHKDCVNHYSEENICVECMNIRETVVFSDSCSLLNRQISLYPADAVNEIAHFLRNGIFNDMTKKTSLINETLVSKQTNPFELDDLTQSTGSFAHVLSDAQNLSQHKTNINTNPFEVDSMDPFDNYDDNLNPFVQLS